MALKKSTQKRKQQYFTTNSSYNTRNTKHTFCQNIFHEGKNSNKDASSPDTTRKARKETITSNTLN
jgi:hypothetical protein